MPTIPNVRVHDVPTTPTISEIVDRAAATVPAAQRAAFRVELRAGLERDAAARRRREVLGEATASAIERGLLSVTDGARTPKRLSGRELFLARSRGGGADPAPTSPLRGRSSFLNRGRFGGFDSPEEQREAAAKERAAIVGSDGAPEATSATATLATATNAPPGYRRQQNQFTPPSPESGPKGPLKLPTPAEAIRRGIGGPPYTPTLRGRELAMFRQRWGRDPLPGEDMNFGTKPPAAGGAR